MLALALRRFGVACRLIDKASRRAETSRALGIHARTMELLDCCGWGAAFRELSHPVGKVVLHSAGKFLAALDFTKLESSSAGIHIVPQNTTEQLLEQELINKGGTVERPAELLELVPEAGVVRARIQDRENIIEEIRYDYVIGCDGAHSTVRHALGLEFTGAAYPEFFGLADVEIEGDLSEKELSLFYHPEGVLAFFPFGGKKFRIVAQMGGSSAEEGIGLEDLQEAVAKRTGRTLTLGQPTWLTGFRTHHRMVGQLRTGRCFLVGDAAHIHSPAGGQGMNTGLQDAINLGWKLALVALGRAPEALLQTYDEERRPVAREVLANTDRMMLLATTENPLLKQLRERFLPELAARPGLSSQILGELSQIAVNYRQSSLTLENRWRLPGQPGLQAGDRLPDGELIAPGGRRSRIFEAVREPGFHLFLLPRTASLYGGGSFGQARALSQDLQADFGSCLKVHWILTPAESMALRKELPEHWVDTGGVLAGTFGLPGGGMLLVRPDYYVGAAASDFDGGRVRLSTLQYWI